MRILIVVLMLTAVVFLALGEDRRLNAVTTKRVLACPAARALAEVVDAAGDLAKWRMAKTAIVNGCTIVDRGERVVILDSGGILWWRTKIDRDGKNYWLPSDAL